MVALSLVDSLQGDDAPDDEITKSWVAEARKRSEDVRAGRSSAMALGDFRSWFKSL